MANNNNTKPSIDKYNLGVSMNVDMPKDFEDISLDNILDAYSVSPSNDIVSGAGGSIPMVGGSSTTPPTSTDFVSSAPLIPHAQQTPQVPVETSVPQVIPQPVQPTVQNLVNNASNLPTMADLIYTVAPEIQNRRIQEYQRMNQLQGNPISNIGQDAGELASGLLRGVPMLASYPAGTTANLLDFYSNGATIPTTNKYFSDAKQVSNTINEEMAKWYLGTTPKQKLGDLLYGTVGGVTGEQFNQSKNAKDYLGYLARNLYNRPVTTGLDIVSDAATLLGGAGAAGRGLKTAANIVTKTSDIGKTIRAANKTPIKAIEKATANTAKAHQDLRQVSTKLDAIHKVDKVALTDAIRAMEEGISTASEAAKPVIKMLTDFQSEWKKVINKVYPKATMFPDDVAAAAQYLVRKTGVTYHDALKQVTLAKEAINESIKNNAILKDFKDFTKGINPENIVDITKGSDILRNLDITKLTGIPKEVAEFIKDLNVVLVDDKAVGKNLAHSTNAFSSASRNSILLRYDMFNPEVTYRGLLHEGFHAFVNKQSKTNPKFANIRKQTVAANKAVNDFRKDTKAYENYRMVDQYFDINGIKPLIQDDKGKYVINKNLNFPTPDTKSIEMFNDFKRGLTAYKDYLNNPEETLARKMGGYAEKITKTDNVQYIPKGDVIKTDIPEVEPIVKESLDKAKSGEIKYITHAGAETVDTINDALGVEEAVKYMGKSSDRVLGSASYEDIAKNLKNNTEWLKTQTGRYVNELNKKDILSDAAKPLNEADTVYVNPKQVEDATNIDNIITSIEPTNTATKPISKKFLEDLASNQEYLADTNPFRKNTLMADMWNLTKSTALGSGTYLTGNAVTGATNALINSNALLPLDIVQAMGSKGELLKNLGIFRNYQRTKSNIKNPALSFFERTNRPVSNAFNAVDATMQNFFGEVAAHNKLRSMGVPYGKRVKKVLELTAQDQRNLYNLVNDIDNTALIMNGSSWIPRSARGAVGLTSGQFWRWNETALKSAGYMYKKHPLLMNVAVNHILADLGGDLEMQNRLNINVDKNVPDAHLKIDERTGDVKEVRAEYLPVMNSVSLGLNLQRALNGENSPEEVFHSHTPLAMILVNAFEGKNEYGKPIKRPDVWVDYKTNKRYKDGKEVKTPYMDEILTTMIKHLSVYPKLYNNTIAPTIQTIQGDNYYQPYENSLFGSSNPTIAPNFLQSANPEKVVTPDAQINRLSGMYENKYYDRDFKMGKREMMRMLRGEARQKGKRRQEIERYLRGY